MSHEESFMDQSVLSPPTLAIAHQNCSAVLDSSRYPESLHLMIEFLKSSTLNKALTAHARVSIKALTKAYITSKYNSAKNVVEFELVGSRNSSSLGFR